ncbi:SOS response-associated peptidase [Neolewinella antarctica]|uniref:Abasic site processing protein n=1 Tax=Neolewinella antarctica TaxID=442734 RepID=A0ABX0XHJ0_9BACT|nr:SOS response-associated peptidase [Neolewinella antarctica]NJC28217.1 putative SOS response-associated peptidase YedK [Neolewinella antarctica]
MCGRYSVVIDEAKLRKQFTRDLLLPKAGLPTNYNVAPTQNNLVITNRSPDEVSLFRWGLVPFWAKDLKIGARMINARREGIEDKASFRKPIREKRCLVIADSFYEWQRKDGKKVPHRILPTDGSLLVMAGIWESWKDKTDPAAETVYTYSIITGEPNAEMAPIHDRMPMLLQNEDLQKAWLDEASSLEDIKDLLRTPADGVLSPYPVSQLVGNVRNNGPELHERA